MRTISTAKTIAGRHLVRSGKREYQGSQGSIQHSIFQNYHVCASNNKGCEDDEHERLQNKSMQNVSIGNKPLPAPSLTFTPALGYYQSRYYVTSTKPKEKSGVTLAMGLGAVAATAKAGQYVAQAYQQWKESVPSEEKATSEKTKEEDTTMNMNGNEKGGEETKKDQKAEKKQDDGERENIFKTFFNLNVGTKYYEGGFEDKMTRREAALILGVRESSTAKRIKDAHRKLLILNHPDTGGSTFLAGKINEAKELLLKGKK